MATSCRAASRRSDSEACRRPWARRGGRACRALLAGACAICSSYAVRGLSAFYESAGRTGGFERGLDVGRLLAERLGDRGVHRGLAGGVLGLVRLAHLRERGL